LDARGSGPEILEQIEIRPARLVKGQDFTVHNSVLREIAEGLDDMWELPVEGFSAPGKQRQNAI
jgi:hypothetical protein